MNKSSMATASLVFLLSASAMADCAGESGNEVANCGFNDDLAGWAMVTGDSFSHVTSGQRSGAGAASVNAFDASGNFVLSIESDCFVPSEDTGYAYGAQFQLAAAVGSTVECRALMTTYTMASCAGSASVTNPTFTIINASSYSAQVTTPLNTTGISSAKLTVACASFTGSDFIALIDDVFAGPGLTPVELQHFSID